MRQRALGVLLSLLAAAAVLPAQAPIVRERCLKAIAYLTDFVAGEDALRELVHFGNLAVPVLKEALDNPALPPDRRLLVLEALGRMGPDGAAALPRLLRELENCDGRTGQGQRLLWCIGRIAPFASPASRSAAVQALVEMRERRDYTGVAVEKLLSWTTPIDGGKQHLLDDESRDDDIALQAACEAIELGLVTGDVFWQAAARERLQAELIDKLEHATAQLPQFSYGQLIGVIAVDLLRLGAEETPALRRGLLWHRDSQWRLRALINGVGDRGDGAMSVADVVSMLTDPARSVRTGALHWVTAEAARSLSALPALGALATTSQDARQAAQFAAAVHTILGTLAAADPATVALRAAIEHVLLGQDADVEAGVAGAGECALLAVVLEHCGEADPERLGALLELGNRRHCRSAALADGLLPVLRKAKAATWSPALRLFCAQGRLAAEAVAAFPDGLARAVIGTSSAGSERDLFEAAAWVLAGRDATVAELQAAAGDANPRVVVRALCELTRRDADLHGDALAAALQRRRDREIAAPWVTRMTAFDQLQLDARLAAALVLAAVHGEALPRELKEPLTDRLDLADDDVEPLLRSLHEHGAGSALAQLEAKMIEQLCPVQGLGPMPR
jgi:hypothetical protein